MVGNPYKNKQTYKQTNAILWEFISGEAGYLL